MSRYLDAMRTRLEKINNKILPLELEAADLKEAISIFEKKEAAVIPPVEAGVASTNLVSGKEPTPHFLKK